VEWVRVQSTRQNGLWDASHINEVSGLPKWQEEAEGAEGLDLSAIHFLSSNSHLVSYRRKSPQIRLALLQSAALLLNVPPVTNHIQK
jgi:hypothetical protein